MKKKIILIIASCLQIILGIFSFFRIDAIANSIKESLKIVELPSELAAEVNSLMELFASPYLIGIEMALFVAINILLLILILTNCKKKALKIVFAALAIAFSINTFSTLLAILLLILICITKTNNKEIINEEKPKENLPVIKNDSNKKDIILSIILILAFAFPFIFFRIYNPVETLEQELMVNGIIYLILVILAITFNINQIKNNFNKFKENKKTYLKFMFKTYGICIILVAVSNVIISSITGQTESLNQQSLEELPIYFLAVTAIIYAPLVEEMVFRVSLKRLIKNDKLFIIISSIAFGVLHTISEESILLIILNAIPYCVLGFCLSYLYSKSKNMFTNIGIHLFQNTISTIVIILLSLIS